MLLLLFFIRGLKNCLPIEKYLVTIICLRLKTGCKSLLAILFIPVVGFLFKTLLPDFYDDFLDWFDDRNKIVIIPLLGQFLFFYAVVGAINQMYVPTPIKKLITQINDKKIVSEKGHCYYYSQILLPLYGTLEIEDKGLYLNADIGDNVRIRIRKGNLNIYYALDVTVIKNDYYQLL